MLVQIATDTDTALRVIGIKGRMAGFQVISIASVSLGKICPSCTSIESCAALFVITVSSMSPWCTGTSTFPLLLSAVNCHVLFI